MVRYFLFAEDEQIDEIYSAIDTERNILATIKQRKATATFMPPRHIVLETDYFTDHGLLSTLENIPFLRNIIEQKKVILLKDLHAAACLL